MSPGKTSTLSIRIEPALKEALRVAAEQEHRSIANMVEVLIRDHCARHEIAVRETAELFPETTRPVITPKNDN